MIRTGTLRVQWLGTDRYTGANEYSVTYAPYDGRGGALPARRISADGELVAFLTELHLDAAAIEGVMTDVRREKRSSRPNVELMDEELQRHGLQQMSIFDSVISYLST